LAQPRKNRLKGEHAAARRGELDGERNTIEAIADLRRGAEVVGAVFRIETAGRRTIDKDVDGMSDR
jgi:hypothetical protein